jgi:hypothetical protein
LKISLRCKKEGLTRLFFNYFSQGDIMGNIRDEVERFYMRDYVEERTETRLIEHLSLSDLIFSRNKRVRVGLPPVS